MQDELTLWAVVISWFVVFSLFVTATILSLDKWTGLTMVSYELQSFIWVVTIILGGILASLIAYWVYCDW